MARRHREPDEDDDDDFLPEGVYHDDDDDEPTMVKCPYCQELVYEQAQYCPRCENFISTESPGNRTPKPFWIWVCLILALVASLFAAFA